jgi:uncharacterized protein
MGNAVTHFEVNGSNGKALQKFYADAFDWHVDANNPMNYGMVDTHAGKGINGGIGTPPDGSGGVTFYIEVDDLQKALDKIEKLGGKTVNPPMEIPGTPVKLAHFADPEGHLIGLSTGM